MPYKLQVGVVVVSPSFAYCEKRSNGVLSPSRTVEAVFNGSPHITAYPEYTDNVDLTRGRAQFVIESQHVSPGSQEQGGGYYSDSEYFLARRLNEDGSYNPNGEIVMFSEDNDRADKVSVEVVDKMQMTFVR